MSRLASFAFALLLGSAGTAGAQTAPLACTAQNVNTTVCQVDGLYKCVYNAGGLMIRAAPGYYWERDILSGSCPQNASMPTLFRPPVIESVPAGMAVPGRAPNVRAVQQALAQRGFDPGPIDGVAGGRTRAAVVAFQRANGLQANGNITPEVMQRLGM